MVNLYFLIDIILFIFISFAIYYSYQKKIYIKIFNYFKLFIIITISAKLASQTGISLEKLNILSTDTYTTLILIGFAINVSILFYSWEFLYLLVNKFINSNQIKTFFAKLTVVLEVITIATFSLYIIMQLSISKKYIYPIMIKSYSYVYIKSFYKKFLNDDFVDMILNADTGTNHKEIIFRSLKNSF
jgi:hypothetical protein